MLKLIVAWVIVETAIVQMRLIDLDWALLVAHHELLERQEAKVPGITFFVRHELGDGRGLLKHGSDLELPNASVDIAIPEEWSPVFEMLWLVSWHWVLTDVGNHILIID